MFKDKLKEALFDTGRYQSAVIDKELKKYDPETDIPHELAAQYFELVKAGIKARLANDNDFKALKGTGKLEYLEKLWGEDTKYFEG